MLLFICCQSVKWSHDYRLENGAPFRGKVFLWLPDGFNSNFTPLAFIYTSDRQQKVRKTDPEERQQRVPEVEEALQTFLSVLEQDKDINYPCVSYRLRRF